MAIRNHVRALDRVPSTGNNQQAYHNLSLVQVCLLPIFRMSWRWKNETVLRQERPDAAARVQGIR